MALKTVDKAAYAIVRTYLAAGAALHARYEETGDWPHTNPMVSQLMDTIFEYVPIDAVPMSAAQIADDSDCAVPGRKASCFYITGPVVFSPESRTALLVALNERTSADVLAAFADAPNDADLEWWAVALAAGALIAIGGLPFAGAIVARIAGYLLAAWAAYGLVVPQTADGKSIAEKYLDAVKEGFDGLFKSAIQVGKIGLAAAAIFVAYRLFGGRR